METEKHIECVFKIIYTPDLNPKSSFGQLKADLAEVAN